VIPYGLAVGGRVRIQVYDIAGRAIRSLLDSEQAQGSYRVTWNALNDAGSPAAGGVYWIRMHVARAELTRKAILLR
jgi:flagellar hook assembly protein FlgD